MPAPPLLEVPELGDPDLGTCMLRRSYGAAHVIRRFGDVTAALGEGFRQTRYLTVETTSAGQARDKRRTHLADRPMPAPAVTTNHPN